MSPNVYIPSKLHVVTHRYTSLHIVYSPTPIHPKERDEASTNYTLGGSNFEVKDKPKVEATPMLFDDPEIHYKISEATVVDLRKIFDRFETNG